MAPPEKQRYLNGASTAAMKGGGGEENDEDGGNGMEGKLLQNVKAERDALRLQNDQLWKIIEKQRGIIHMLQTQLALNAPQEGGGGVGAVALAAGLHDSLVSAEIGGLPTPAASPLGPVAAPAGRRDRSMSERVHSATPEAEPGERVRSMSENREGRAAGMRRQSWERDYVLPAIAVQPPSRKTSSAIPGVSGPPEPPSAPASSHLRHHRQRSHSASSQPPPGVVLPPVPGASSGGALIRKSSGSSFSANVYEGSGAVGSSGMVGSKSSQVSVTSNTGVYEYDLDSPREQMSPTGSASHQVSPTPSYSQISEQPAPTSVPDRISQVGINRPRSSSGARQQRKLQQFTEIEESVQESTVEKTTSERGGKPVVPPKRPSASAESRRTRLEGSTRPHTGRGRLHDVSEHEAAGVPKAGSVPMLTNEVVALREDSLDASRTNLESLPGSQPVLSAFTMPSSRYQSDAFHLHEDEDDIDAKSQSKQALLDDQPIPSPPPPSDDILHPTRELGPDFSQMRPSSPAKPAKRPSVRRARTSTLEKTITATTATPTDIISPQIPRTQTPESTQVYQSMGTVERQTLTGSPKSSSPSPASPSLSRKSSLRGSPSDMHRRPSQPDISARGSEPGTPSGGSQQDLSSPTQPTPGPTSGVSDSNGDIAMDVTKRTDILAKTNLDIQVVGSHVRVNDKGKDFVGFIISVKDGSGNELWKVEKLYSDFLGLDAKLKAHQPRALVTKIGKLPDKALFNTYAPSKSDQRKIALELYLQHVKNVCRESRDLCEFLAMDIVESDKGKLKPKQTTSNRKEGYLFKKGKKIGGWKTRYFILQEDTLAYFESRDRELLGAIKLKYAAVSSQSPSSSAMDPDYRHAFILTEFKKSVFSGNAAALDQISESKIAARHVLCAENDEERDDWVRCIGAAIQELRPDDTARRAVDLLGSNLAFGTMGASDASLNRSFVGSSRSELDEGKKDSGKKKRKDKKSKLGDDGGELSDSTSKDGTGPRNRDGTIGRSKDGQSTPPEGPYELSMSPVPMITSDDQPSFTLDPPNNTILSAPIPITPSSSTLDRVPSSHSPNSTLRSGTYPPPSQYPMMMGGSNPMMMAPPASPGPQRTIKNYVDDNERVLQQPVPPPLVAAEEGRGTGGRSDGAGKEGKKSKRVTSAFSWAKRKAGANDTARVADPTRKVFGVPLEQAVAVSKVSDNYELPAVVYRCIEYLDAKNAAEEEGIYRLSGSTSTIQGLKARFDSEGDVDLLGSGEFYDVHAVSGLLKLYLRELPIPILTKEMQADFLHVTDLMDRNERISELENLVVRLPLANYTLLRALIAHLIRVVQKCDVNRMTVRNIGIVFSPTLGIPAGVFTLMMAEYESIFGSHGTMMNARSTAMEMEEDQGVSGNGGGNEMEGGKDERGDEKSSTMLGGDLVPRPPPRDVLSASTSTRRARASSASRTDHADTVVPTSNYDQLYGDQQLRQFNAVPDVNNAGGGGGTEGEPEDLPAPKRRQHNSAKRRARQTAGMGFRGLPAGEDFGFDAGVGQNRGGQSYMETSSQSARMYEQALMDIRFREDEGSLEADIFGKPEFGFNQQPTAEPDDSKVPGDTMEVDEEPHLQNHSNQQQQQEQQQAQQDQNDFAEHLRQQQEQQQQQQEQQQEYERQQYERQQYEQQQYERQQQYEQQQQRYEQQLQEQHRQNYDFSNLRMDDEPPSSPPPPPLDNPSPPPPGNGNGNGTNTPHFADSDHNESDDEVVIIESDREVDSDEEYLKSSARSTRSVRSMGSAHTTEYVYHSDGSDR